MEDRITSMREYGGITQINKAGSASKKAPEIIFQALFCLKIFKVPAERTMQCTQAGR